MRLLNTFVDFSGFVTSVKLGIVNLANLFARCALIQHLSGLKYDLFNSKHPQ